MNKYLVIGVLLVVLIGGVSAYSVKWSNPSVPHETNKVPLKTICHKAEWNNKFEDYRAGLISKDDMKDYIGSCKW